MTMSVSRYHEFDYWFDCWEMLPGQLGKKVLIQWCPASVTAIWKERERGFGRKRNVKSVGRRREGFQHSPGGFLWCKKQDSLPAGISLTPSLTLVVSFSRAVSKIMLIIFRRIACWLSLSSCQKTPNNLIAQFVREVNASIQHLFVQNYLNLFNSTKQTSNCKFIICGCLYV